MPSLTRPRFSHCRLLAVLAVFAGLASGCQSSRPSFSFQPIMLRTNTPGLHASAYAAPTLVSATPPEAGPMQPTAAVPAAVIPAAQPALGAAAATAGQLPSRGIQAQNQVGAATAAVATGVSAAGRQAGLPRRHLLRRAHAPAAQGLGLTVLGILGMVVLVVALVGLAISGGGVGWVLTAAIAAGVVVLAYLNSGGH